MSRPPQSERFDMPRPAFLESFIIRRASPVGWAPPTMIRRWAWPTLRDANPNVRITNARCVHARDSLLTPTGSHSSAQGHALGPCPHDHVASPNGAQQPGAGCDAVGWAPPTTSRRWAGPALRDANHKIAEPFGPTPCFALSGLHDSSPIPSPGRCPGLMNYATLWLCRPTAPPAAKRVPCFPTSLRRAGKHVPSKPRTCLGRRGADQGMAPSAGIVRQIHLTPTGSHSPAQGEALGSRPHRNVVSPNGAQQRGDVGWAPPTIIRRWSLPTLRNANREFAKPFGATPCFALSGLHDLSPISFPGRCPGLMNHATLWLCNPAPTPGRRQQPGRILLAGMPACSGAIHVGS